MRGCERLFDGPKARIAKELMEDATGRQCPCGKNGCCPLLPSLSLAPRPPLHHQSLNWPDVLDPLRAIA